MKKTTLQMKEDTFQKLTAVAQREGRSVNQQIVYLLRKNIEEFEQSHGVIPLPEEITDGE